MPTAIFWILSIIILNEKNKTVSKLNISFSGFIKFYLILTIKYISKQISWFYLFVFMIK